MPIDAACPKCAKAFRLRDELAGKKVRCAACQTQFAVPRPEEEVEVAEVVEVTDEPPRPRRRADDEDDRPSRPRARAQVEDGEEDERPARRAKQGGSAGLLVGLLAGGFFLLAAVGVGGYFVYRAVGNKGGTAQGTKKEDDKGGGGPAPDPTKLARIELADHPSAIVSNLHAPTANPSHVVVLRGSLFGPAGRNAATLERYAVGSGRKADGMELTGMQGIGVAGVSPDGSRAAVRHGPFEMDVTVVNLAQGTKVGDRHKFSYQNEGREVRSRYLNFLDNERLLVIYDDEAVDVWKSAPAGWERTPLRRARPPGGFRGSGLPFALSPDAKTLAAWNGAGFDLIDTSSGAVRAQTGGLDLRPGERQMFVSRAQFSPDGKRLLGEVQVSAAGPLVPGAAVWKADAGQKATRLDVKQAPLAQWWGNDHLFVGDIRSLGSANPRGHVHDVATDKELCLVSLEGMPPAPTADGRLWFVHLTRGGAGPTKRELLGVPFPEAQVKGLPAAAGGPLPVLEVKPDGVRVQGGK